MNEATKELVEYYNEFESEFTQFFEELRAFSKLKLIEIESTNP